jgi:hypothetical protein
MQLVWKEIEQLPPQRRRRGAKAPGPSTLQKWCALERAVEEVFFVISHDTAWRADDPRHGRYALEARFLGTTRDLGVHETLEAAQAAAAAAAEAARP